MLKILKLDSYNVVTDAENRLAPVQAPVMENVIFKTKETEIFSPSRIRLEGTTGTILSQHVDNIALVLATAEVCDGSSSIDDKLSEAIVQRMKEIKRTLKERL